MVDHIGETVLPLELFLQSGRCTLSVPAPIRAAQFVGRDGATTGPVVFDRLGQIRARAVSPEATERFVLEGRIQGKTKWLQLARLPNTGTTAGVWELGLGALQEHVENLFATSADLDTEVELRLDTPTGIATKSALKVRRYEERPRWHQVDDDTIEITLASDAITRIGTMGMELLEMELRPLHEPDEPPRRLTCVAEGRWTISSRDLADAPSWFVTGTIGKRVRLRPTVLPSPTYTSSNAAPSELLRLLGEPRATVRKEGLITLVKEMSSDWSRPEWDQLSPFLESMKSLPPTTFDVLYAVASAPSAAASSLFRCGGTEETFRTIWQGFERLPFLWAQVPLAVWISTARSLARWAAAMSDNNVERSSLLIRTFTRPLEAAQHRSPIIQVLHDVFHSVIEHVSRPPSPWLKVPAVALVSLLRAGAQALMLRHPEEWWPTDFSELAFISGRGVHSAVIENAFSNLGIGIFQPVFRIPALLGFAAGCDEALAATSLLDVRRSRTFDPVWFDEAHAIGFALAAGPRVPRR